MLLAFCWFKQAVALVSFPRVALGTFVSSRTWVSTRCFGPVSENHVVGSGFSDGSRLETRDISGSCWLAAPGKLSSAALLCSPLQLSSLLRDVTALHGLGLLQMVGFKASVQRTGTRWRAQLQNQEALVSRGSRESRDSRARAAYSALF